MKILSSKKGAIMELLYGPIRDLVIIIVIIFLPMLGFIYTNANNLEMEKQLLARDLSLLIDTVNLANGNLVLNYPSNTSIFTFKFKDGTTIVYDKEKHPNALPYQTARFPYTQDNYVFLAETEISPNSVAGTYVPVKLRFNKNRNNLVITEQSTEISQDVLNYPDVLTSTDLKNIVLTVIDKENKELVDFVKDPLTHYLSSPKELTVSYEDDPTNQLIIIEIGISPDNNTVKAYFSTNDKEKVNLKSRKLATVIANSFLAQEEFVEKEIEDLPLSDVRVIPKTYPTYTGVAVSIVIGEDLYKEYSPTKSVFANGLKEYYKSETNKE